MAQDLYHGHYMKFYALGGKGSADFIGADNLVGDRYVIEIEDLGDTHRAFLVNRFGDRVGYLDGKYTRDVQLAQAKEWETAAFLSFVAFTEGTDEEHPGYYWGEMAVLMYDHKLDRQMRPFLKTLSKVMADGGRPQIDLSNKTVDMLINDDGSWFPTDKVPRPKMGKGSALIKDHQTPNERLIEQSRKRNIGCYIISWAFIAALVALIIYLLHSCMA